MGNLNLDQCRNICHQMGEHARSFVDTTNEGSEAHGLAVIAQRQMYVLIVEVERLRDELDAAERIADCAHRWYDADNDDQQAFNDLTNAIANSRTRGPYR